MREIRDGITDGRYNRKCAKTTKYLRETKNMFVQATESNSTEISPDRGEIVVEHRKARFLSCQITIQKTGTETSAHLSHTWKN